MALANLDVMAAEDLPGRVLGLEDEFRTALDTLTDLPIVREVRGMGYFYGIELTKNGDRLQRRRVRLADPRLPVEPAPRARPDLPGRRPGRSGHPALAVARRRARGVRRHLEHAPPGAAGGLEGARPVTPLVRGRAHGGQGGRAPGGAHPGRRAGDGVPRRRGAGAGGRRPRGEHPRRGVRQRRRRDRRRRRRGVGAGGDGREGEGAAGVGVRAPARRPHAVHLPAPGRLPEGRAGAAATPAPPASPTRRSCAPTAPSRSSPR